MSNTIFRIFNPKSKQDPVEKRRAQLRRAQQTYRDRKDRYTKSLEQEIAHIRASEAGLSYDAQCLRDTVNALMGVLSEHGIEPPASPWCNSAQSQTQVVQSPFSTEGFMEHHHQSDNPASSRDKKPWFDDNTVASPSARPDLPHQLLSSEHSPLITDVSGGVQYEASGQAELLPERRRRRICDTDAATVGMEFVLTIETPCLGHIHANPQKPHEPHGHALTATAQLSYASSTLRPGSSALDSAAIQYMPSDMLDRLLDLSPALSSEDEVTPVQAWNHIRSQPYFGHLDIRYLQRLADKLREAAVCHGFGAVVEQTRFHDLLKEVLGLGQAK